MSHTLYRAQNYRNLLLDETTIDRATVGVRCRSGEFEYRRWLGFIRRCDARAQHDAKPVLLAVSRVDGVDVLPGTYVQGCLVERGVYAVIDSEIALVVKE